MAVAQYRWLTGHQLTFCVWRLLADALHPLTRGIADEQAVKAAAALYDAYSLLLLYCGSCSPQIYADVIRPQMMRVDPAFTGRWARDFQPIEPMMHKLRTTDTSIALDELFTAAADNDRIHRAVAIRLIPGGHSLLRSSGRDLDAPPTDEEHSIYDDFFEVEREQLTHEGSFAIMQQRLSAVRADLLAHPLPVPCEWDGLNSRDTALVDRFHRDSIDILDGLEELTNEPT